MMSQSGSLASLASAMGAPTIRPDGRGPRHVNVLYVDHTSQVSGAQGALLDLLDGLPVGISPTLMCPPGQLADAARERGVRVVEFPGTTGSLRIHPTQTPRALAEILRSGRILKRTVDDIGADLVHANSLRAGLIVASARGREPVLTVLHVHDALPSTRSADLVRRVL